MTSTLIMGLFPQPHSFYFVLFFKGVSVCVYVYAHMCAHAQGWVPKEARSIHYSGAVVPGSFEPTDLGTGNQI